MDRNLDHTYVWYGESDALARNTPDILPRTPKRIKKQQHILPAVRLAHRVIAITPLFCNVVFVSSSLRKSRCVRVLPEQKSTMV